MDSVEHDGAEFLVIGSRGRGPIRSTVLGSSGTAPPLSGQLDTRARLADQIVHDPVGAAGGEATGIVEPGRPWDVLESVADREGGGSSSLLVSSSRSSQGAVNSDSGFAPFKTDAQEVGRARGRLVSDTV